ncbi:MAG TPA: hypothetical protein VGM11_02830 [Acidobacteriaceae bacterium]|jgi:hypothetical protein
MLPHLLLSLALSSATFRCVAHRAGGTPALIASNGTRFTLRVDMDDDYGKNTHLCEADFTFASALPYQPESQNNAYSSDDAWDRSVALAVYGFDSRDRRVFGIIREGAAPSSVTLFSYDIRSREVGTIDLDRTFRNKLPRACIPLLTVVGTGGSDESEIILATDRTPGCPSRRFALALARDAAQRDIVRSLRVLPAEAAVLPLDAGRTQP